MIQHLIFFFKEFQEEKKKTTNAFQKYALVIGTEFCSKSFTDKNLTAYYMYYLLTSGVILFTKKV